MLRLSNKLPNTFIKTCSILGYSVLGVEASMAGGKTMHFDDRDAFENLEAFLINGKHFADLRVYWACRF